MVSIKILVEEIFHNSGFVQKQPTKVAASREFVEDACKSVKAEVGGISFSSVHILVLFCVYTLI